MPKGQPVTEAEWLVATDTSRMLRHLRRRASDRKRRLFIAACCRRIWDLLDEDGRGAVEVAERYADGAATDRDRQAASGRLVPRILEGSAGAVTGAYGAVRKDVRDTRLHVGTTLAVAAAAGAGGDRRDRPHRQAAARQAEEAAQVAILRCMFGNPFHPVALDPSWLTSAVTALAQQMYAGRDFHAMPILADALQDAGCDDEQVMGHCRGPGPHVRGCWVVDLILGKT